EGCFLALLNSRPIGMGIATSHGECGFIGEIIVLPEERGRGVGRVILDHAVRYLLGKGCRSISLDGVVKAVPLYERAGFRKVCRSCRFYGHFSGRMQQRTLHPNVRHMTEADLVKVLRLDRDAFGADRSFFLLRRFRMHPELCHIFVQSMDVYGYLFGRRGNHLVSFGPWYCDSHVSFPAALLQNAAAEVEGMRIGVGVLETNGNAIECIRSIGLEERPDPPWRMVLGQVDRLGMSERLYAIGSAATG
ncbi:MAG TPA: GNAT family N-acetyltransferase, partial [bacterium]